ncbi:hypothetical protein HO133_004954 [Letharia lupina]|uniref:FHA domain-containing protein n=1 Tax=Letharia lupina TaxID=560253 RepID=A0A8H6C9G3_9LECA|nr:uncharacterized protein HO133_004954 [Letharia lupina]KAF6219129.1 hypothetical protein HO133_004954 [Letharia lupina]
MIEKGETDLRGNGALTDLNRGTRMVQQRETTRDQTIAEGGIVQEVHAKIIEGREESMRPAADRRPTTLEALETIANFQSVTTAHLALLRRSGGVMTLETVAASKRSNGPLPSQQAAFKKDPTSDAVVKAPEEVEKQKPNYAPTGKLAAETNTVANTSIVLKYNEPPEARLPPSSSAWRLYVFKGSDLLETLSLHERSCWLFGRERAVVDFPTEHPSCSKQHAVLQFRYTERKDEWGEKKGGVKPYVIDLDSANGTRVNGEKVPERRYVEVRSGDVVTLGESTREYVLMLPPKEPPKG